MSRVSVRVDCVWVQGQSGRKREKNTLCWGETYFFYLLFFYILHTLETVDKVKALIVNILCI